MPERALSIIVLLATAYAGVYFAIDRQYGMAGMCTALTLISFWTVQAVWADATTGDQFESE